MFDSGVCAAIAVLALSVLCDACAWNDHGLARVDRSENETSRLVRIDVWGAHLVTGSDDSGVTLGHSRRVYIYPRSNSLPPDKLDLAHLGDGRAEGLKPAGDHPDAAAERPKPVVSFVRTAGASIDLSTTRIGLHLGLRSRAMMRVPLDSNLLIHVRFDGRHPENASTFMKGKWE